MEASGGTGEGGARDASNIKMEPGPEAPGTPDAPFASARAVAAAAPKLPPAQAPKSELTAAVDSQADPWFSSGENDDREIMPWQLVEQLLRDDSFSPGRRPSQLIVPGDAGALPRSKRVFKEIRDGSRRKRSVDVWHNAGGNRSRRCIPHTNPVMYRRYGMVETTLSSKDGTTERVALFNYHEYKLIEPPEGHVATIFHAFVVREKGWTKKTKAARGARHTVPGFVPVGTAPGSSKSAALHLTDAADGSGRKSNFVVFEKVKQLGRLTESDAGGIQFESIGGDVSTQSGVACGFSWGCF